MQQTTTKQNTFGTLVLEQVWSRLGKNYRYPCNEYYQLAYPLREFLSDYYPFGSSLPTRSWSDASRAYRFGFNTQEKDNEVAGEGNSYTAEFWQYDSRLGRRFNIDPIVKDDLSSYSVLSGSPIHQKDPKGDDDFFDENGKFLKSEGTTDNIWVRVGGVDKLYHQIPLTTIDEKKVASNVFAYYCGQMGTGGIVGVGNNNDPDVLAYTSGDKIYLNIHFGINPELSNIKNLKSTIFHEKVHKSKGHGWKDKVTKKSKLTDFEHVKVYLEQVNDQSFKVATESYRNKIAGSVKKYLELAINSGTIIGNAYDEVSKLVNEFNKNSKWLGYTYNIERGEKFGEYKISMKKNEENKK